MEILVVAVLALVVFGPEKLPEIARTVGGFIRQVRTMADDVKQEFSDGFDIGDEPEDEEFATTAAARDEDDDDDEDLARLDEDHSAERGSEGGPEDAKEAAEHPGAEESPPHGRKPTEHPVAGAVRAEREAERRAEGA